MVSSGNHTVRVSEPADPGKGARRMRSLLLDRRFQLKYIAMTLGLAAVLCGSLGLFLYDVVRENSRLLSLDPAFQQELAASDARILWTMLGSFLIFFVLLGLMSLFITHRMAGPIFVMRRYIREVGAGTLPRMRKLRRGDEFIALFKSLESALEKMERRTLEEIGLLERALQALPPDGPEAPEVELRRGLAELLAQKRKMLESRVQLE